MRTFIFFLVGLAIAGNAPSQDKQVQSILKKYDRLRPAARALGMYQLDWAETLKEAQTRAKREGRPIALVIIHARYGDLHSGHC